jgi:YggT family protein
MTIICVALQLYLIVLFARVLLSWFPISPGGAMSSIADILVTLTEPVLGPLRRAIPPVRMGTMGLDVSPLIAFFGVIFLQQLVCG